MKRSSSPAARRPRSLFAAAICTAASARLSIVGFSIVGLGVIAISLAAGCRGGDVASPEGPAPPKPALSAADILQHAIQAYKSADSYSDRGVLRLSYRADGRLLVDEGPLEVAFVRPGKLRVRAYQVMIACDGETFRAQIIDPASNNFDHQIVVRPAAETMSLQELYSDRILHDVIQNGLGRHPVALELLLGENPLEPFLKRDVEMRLLEEETIEGRVCHRLEIKTSQGVFTLAIDQESHLLRKMTYPAEAFVPELAGDDSLGKVALVAEFRNARFGGKLSSEMFLLESQPTAKQVHFFIPPPQPLPSALFGKKPGDFYFTTPQKGKTTRQDLAGKIAVLVWFHNEPNCQASLQELEKVRLQYQDNSQVAFYAVCTQPSDFSSQTLAEMLGQWRVRTELVRDLKAFGRDVFGVPGAPTLVVLDKQGVVQIFEVGFNPNLAAELPTVLEKLLKGENLSQEILRLYEQERREYERNLLLASGEQGQTILPEKTPLAEKSEPRQLKLTKLWSTQKLTAPGNLLLLPGADETKAAAEPAAKILALDGWRSVVELNEQGKVIARRELDLPENAGLSYLRTATDAQGKRYYAGSSILAPQLFVFDGDWKLLSASPDSKLRHAGLRDVQIADFAGKGEIELAVGFWADVGVQGLALSGSSLWSNRIAPTVMSLALTPPDDQGERKIIVTGEQGSLVLLDSRGVHSEPIRVEKRGVHQIYAAQFDAAGATAYCGVSYDQGDRLTVIGLSPDFREQWNYELPPGIFHNQIQFVVSGELLDDKGQWVIAAPDGTLHIIGHDGLFRDHLGMGKYLTGLAIAKFAERRVLLIATEKEITAWAVERLSEAPLGGRLP